MREELADAPGAELASYLDIVTNAAQLMGRQIDGLIQWSQLDRVVLVETALDMPALIAEARQSLAAQAAGRQIDWQVAADFPRLHGDGIFAERTFDPFVVECAEVHANPPAGRDPGGWQQAAEGSCLLFVRDNGVGFNRRQRDKAVPGVPAPAQRQ